MLGFAQNFKLFCQEFDLLLMFVTRQFETDCLLTISFGQLFTVHEFGLGDSEILLQVFVDAFNAIHVVLELLIFRLGLDPKLRI